MYEKRYYTYPQNEQNYKSMLTPNESDYQKPNNKDTKRIKSYRI